MEVLVKPGTYIFCRLQPRQRNRGKWEGASGCIISCSLFSRVTLKKFIRVLFSVGFFNSNIHTLFNEGYYVFFQKAGFCPMLGISLIITKLFFFASFAICLYFAMTPKTKFNPSPYLKGRWKFLKLTLQGCHQKNCFKMGLMQAWTNCASDANQVNSGMQNFCSMANFLGMQNSPCKKKKHYLCRFSAKQSKQEKVIMNSKQYHNI